MYEVFDPRIGETIFTTRFRWLAHLLAWWWNYDYDLNGVDEVSR
jgi:hypothetical protein